MMTKRTSCRLFLLTLVALLLLGACKGRIQPKMPLDSTAVNTEGVVREPHEGFELITIQDKPSRATRDLFASYPAELIDSLLPAEGIATGINCFLIANDHITVLVDAGLGSEAGGVLLEKLAALQVRPEKIDAVLLTHFHPDHIGGLLHNGGPAFPTAHIYASVPEFEAWTQGELAARNEQVMAMLSNYAERLHLFMDGDTLMDHIVAHLAPGHTPGHTLFERGDVLIVGDMFHAAPLQTACPELCARYDMDTAQAVQSRIKWTQYARQHQLTIVGMHVALPGVVQ